MEGRLHLMAICAIVLSIAGCEKKTGGGLGGGSSSIAAGGGSKSYVYGIQTGKKLAFVLFSDISGESQAGSSWTGYIKPQEGLAVDYKGDMEGLVINGTRHEFTNGRVFLVATKSGTASVEQLDVPIGEGEYLEELDSLKERAEVKEFLGR